MPCIRVSQDAGLCVDDAEERRDEHAVVIVLTELIVRRGNDTGS